MTNQNETGQDVLKFVYIPALMWYVAFKVVPF